MAWDKKALSYAKDRRNDYGEHDKSSRRSIRRHKRVPHRANRHQAHQLLSAAAGAGVDLETAQQTEVALLTRKPKTWRKCPDAQLSNVVIAKLRRRARLGMQDPADVEARIDRIRRRVRSR